MRKLINYILITTLFLSVTLTGCGGGNSNQSGNNYTPSQAITYIVGGTLFNMHYIPGATSFPTGINDSGTCAAVNHPYWMAETEVTYQLWSSVYTWASTNGYTFSSNGSRGGWVDEINLIYGSYPSGHNTDPVTNITWRDAIVWCNALTEYYNLQNWTSLGYAYTSNGAPIKDSKSNISVLDNLTNDGRNSKGFRLPTSMEWELAARYRGNDNINAITVNEINYTKGNSASGATNSWTDTSANNLVSWNYLNSFIDTQNANSTHPIGQLNANTLGLYDMSGNVAEWCFEQYSASERIIRGGDFWGGYGDCEYLQLGYAAHCGQGGGSYSVGFRFARTP